jgi:hypothetical protein
LRRGIHKKIIKKYSKNNKTKIKRQKKNRKTEKKQKNRKKTKIKKLFFSINNKLKTFLHVMVLQSYKKWVNVLQSGLQSSAN